MDRPTVTALVDSLSHDMVRQEDDACRDIAPDGFDYLPLVEACRRCLDDGGRRHPPGR